MKLTKEQMEVVKRIAEYAEAFCNQVYHIMKNHGLDEIEGCALSLYVDPEYDFTTESISMGAAKSEFGNFTITKGKKDEEFSLLGKNSPEYEILFGRPEVVKKLVEHPLPPDGLWISEND